MVAEPSSSADSSSNVLAVVTVATSIVEELLVDSLR